MPDASPMRGEQAPWRVWLPVGGGDVLAAGLTAAELVALGRARGRLDVCGCAPAVLEEAQAGGAELRALDGLPSDARYAAIAVGETALVPAEVARRLVPGGTAVWRGSVRSVPGADALARAGFASTREHAVLPPGSGKLTLPLSTSRAARAGLALYRPGGRAMQTAALVGRAATRLGARRWLGRGRVHVARGPGAALEDAYLVDVLGARLGKSPTEATLYVYTGDFDASKLGRVTLQLLDGAGTVLGVAKVSDAPESHESHGALARERATLAAIAQESALRAFVPRLLWGGRWRAHEVLLQSAADVGPARSPGRFTAAHVQVLAALAEVACEDRPLAAWREWPGLVAWADRSSHAARELLAGASAALGDTPLPLHRVHGDFARSNVLIGPRGVCVVDWEESVPAGLPFADLVHFAARQRAIRAPGGFALDEAARDPEAWLAPHAAVQPLLEAAPRYRRLGSPAVLRAVLGLALVAEARREDGAEAPSSSTPESHAAGKEREVLHP